MCGTRVLKAPPLTGDIEGTLLKTFGSGQEDSREIPSCSFLRAGSQLRRTAMTFQEKK